MRRSLAFDAVGLVKYETFNSWVNWMFQTIRQQPPPGFNKPSLAQPLRADRQAFIRLQEQSRDGIKPHADGTRPLDGLIKNLINDHTVSFHLLPTQAPLKAPAGDQDPSWKKKQGWDYANKWGKKQVWQQYNKTSSGSGSKGHGKNGGKLPQALRGCASTTPQGGRICFAFNINGCDKCMYAPTKGAMATIPRVSAPRGAPEDQLRS